MASETFGAEKTERRSESGSPLIASDRVEGTAVRRSDGQTIGKIDRLVIEKRSGRVAYVIMTFGGLLGMGEEEHTLPWNVLQFDTELDAYRLDLSDDQLRDAPRRSKVGPDDPSFDRTWEDHVHRYFNADPYWDESVPRATHETRTP